MSSSQSDPHDDVPDLFPQDVWEDVGQQVKDTRGSTTLLPPRKAAPEISPPSPTDSIFPGLRIGATAQASPENPEDSNLEVHEIDGRVLRLEPEKPTQPKMPRQVSFHEKSAPQPLGLDSPLWGKSKIFSPKWILGISLGVAAVIIAALSLLPVINRPNAIKSDQKNSLVLAGDEDDLVESAGPYDELVTRSKEAMAIFRKFKTVSTRMKILPMLRDRDAVEPLVLSSHRPVLISKSWDPEAGAQWEVHENKGSPFAVLRGKLPDYSGFSAYFVMENDQLLIDWKATTGYGSATFDELNAGQGTPDEIRGVISPAKYFSPVFPEKEFHSFLLSLSDSEIAVWCYTRRGQPVDEALTGLCHGGDIRKSSSVSHKVTLRLERGPEDSLPNQWMVAKMLNDEWISP